jgi:hypothetical protein
MALEVLDVVAELPVELHRTALALSESLAGRMAACGRPSHFRLGEPFPGGSGGPCEPHVSIFMLTADESEIDDIFWTTCRVAASLPALEADGERYQHNPVGAPELYFRKTAEWIELQRAVIAEVAPLRRGRLREKDPSGARIQDILDDPRQDPVRQSQLLRFGYDEVTERWDGGPDDRFNPHVTLAWPVDPAFRIELADLPPADEFSGMLTELAVYGMSPYGTCTKLYGTAPLGVAGSDTGTSTAHGHGS